MKRLTLLKLLLISLLSGAALSVIYFFTLRIINESSGQNHRQELVLSIASEIEAYGKSEIASKAVQAVAQYDQNHQTRRGEIRMPIWIVDQNGKALAASRNIPLQVNWNEIVKPQDIHDLTIKYKFMSLSPEIICIRLDSPSPLYLLFSVSGRRAPNLIWGIPILFVFATVAISIFLALFITFFYLQKKSKEAKEILAQLGNGNLKARFKILRFDEIGNLMLDFNRMASEIEKLVGRVQNAERARRNLLQELSHDLRTPLTSLRTSIETLHSYGENMTTLDRQEFFAMVDSELIYLVRLLEDLFFIAEIDEPSYKHSTTKINLSDLMSTELKSRQSQRSNGVELLISDKSRHPFIWGDSHLILRLFKNALDNTERFARKKVEIKILETESFCEIHILDDGPGFNPEKMANFGSRRRHRTELLANSKNTSHFSLGLGSVIMRTIAELHYGKIEISNEMQSDQIQGALLKIIFPKMQKE